MREHFGFYAVLEKILDKTVQDKLLNICFMTYLDYLNILSLKYILVEHKYTEL